MTPKLVLVVDDDAIFRRILRNFLVRFGCEVTEACNGVEALAAIGTAFPDAVFLDVNLPVLNGIETLEEIRASTAYAHLPVIAVSAHPERKLVTRLIELGITGYLAKPLRAPEVMRRLEAIFEKLQSEQDQRATARNRSTGRDQVLLLVDRDPNFRRFARQLLEERFHVVEADTGVAALEAFSRALPGHVLVGRDLQLLRPERFIRMIRGQQTSVAPHICLMDEGGAGAEPVPGADRVIRKSLVPELFLRELRYLLEPGEEDASSLAAFVRSGLGAELATAVHQSAGVLASEEVLTLERADLSRTAGLTRARERLQGEEGTAVLIELYAAREDVEQLGSRILDPEAGQEGGAAGAVAELVSTIAGRVRASLSGQGFRL